MSKNTEIQLKKIDIRRKTLKGAGKKQQKKTFF